MTGLLLLVSLLLCVDMVGHYADYCEADRGDGVCTIIEQYDETQSPTERNNLLLTELQRYRMSLDMKPNTVDDQYIGCSDTLETEVMPKVLRQETSLNPAFRLAWNLGEKEWKKRRTSVRLPGDFRDEFGIAIIVYTSDWPEGNPIYKVFNTHVSLMGISREQYMKEFHFKALHFYITRALQVLKKTSTRRHRVFRGTKDSFNVTTNVLRFGRFTSTSLNLEVAKEYDEGLLFDITTRFGVEIHKISSLPKEKEVLVPVAEKFRYVGKEHNMYIINSTSELCSYFNCAYLGGEKRRDPVCRTVV